MISNLDFYLVALPAIVLYGLGKGGFGGPLSQLAVPIMALVMSPLTAAAILLPVLVLMDAVALYSYWGTFDRRTLLIMLPGAVAGVALGWITASWITPDQVRLLLGLVGLAFTANYVFGGRKRPAQPQRPWLGRFWGMVSGFTSFVSHAGGPPFHMYATPLRLEPRLLAGTAAIFFFVVNVLKLLPYLELGQYTQETLTASLVLLPLAPLATRAGVYLVRIVDPRTFYRIAYAGIFLASVKLTWDGVLAFL
ncbi:sulfite exporter TauE/SafE family protein [Lutibaculum baratangense]|uniref:Probable membrane transporter protein n=1 Tax=Lutibaculum baratangense AMV1 TaxID=631454 RepID=V4QTP0_9HYPH|nr:sulfite exporter TauE/SafE family protein [Lutibaculum baratangense]ESR23132.1 putative integral membrane protein [Lutibaculum baratangense AMV1]